MLNLKFGLNAFAMMSVFVSVCVQVYQTCGTPGEPGTGSPTVHEQRKKSGSLTASEYKPSPTAGFRLEMQVCVCTY